MNPDQEQPSPQPTPPPEQPTPTPTPTPIPTPAQVPTPAPVEPEMTTPNPFSTSPAGPIGSSPVAVDTPTPAPAGGSKKKLIIILSAVIGGILLLGGIAAALYFMLFAVGKQDYQQAFDQMNVIRESIYDDKSVSTASSNKEALAQATTAYETYKVEHAKLADLKAIKFDAEINEKFKVYDAKADEYIAFMDGYLPSVDAYIQASESLKSFSLTSTNVQRAIDAYEDASGKVTDPTLKASVDSVLSALKEMLPQVKIYENTSNPISQRIAAANKLGTISRQLSTESTTLSADLSKRIESISPRDSFDELGELITKKLNEA